MRYFKPLKFETFLAHMSSLKIGTAVPVSQAPIRSGLFEVPCGAVIVLFHEVNCGNYYAPPYREGALIK